MSAAVLARAASRGGYGAIVRKQIGPNRWGAIRSFTAAQRLQEKKYAKTHEWIEYSADGKTATVGVSNYAVKALGDAVYIELPTNGAEVAAGESFAAVESVKSASDIYTPVTGTVSESNADLEEKPSLLNSNAEDAAWIAKLDVTGPESDGLLSAEEYNKYTEGLSSE